MKTAATRTHLSRHTPTHRKIRRPTPVITSGKRSVSSIPSRVAIQYARRDRSFRGIRWLVNKILLLLAAALMAVAVTQKPSMLLLLLTPTAMVATAILLFMGLLAAACIRTCVPSPIGRPYALLPGGWRTFAAFVLTLGLLALLYNVFGSQPFGKLRMGDLVMHKAYVTQLVAFALLWLALLR
jgi:hypothetical protein